MLRKFPECGAEGCAHFHIAADIAQKQCQSRIRASAPDDVKCLQQGNSRLHHRCQLPGKNGDVFDLDRGIAALHFAPLHAFGLNALARQLQLGCGLAGGTDITAYQLPVRRDSAPIEYEFLGRFFDLTHWLLPVFLQSMSARP